MTRLTHAALTEALGGSWRGTALPAALRELVRRRRYRRRLRRAIRLL